jgi:hypothetical protein
MYEYSEVVKVNNYRKFFIRTNKKNIYIQCNLTKKVDIVCQKKWISNQIMLSIFRTMYIFHLMFKSRKSKIVCQFFYFSKFGILQPGVFDIFL